MPRAVVNGIEIEYETSGKSSEPTVLLVMGLGGQLIAWDDEFCELLADAGFFVVRFDNRDVGLSTHLDAPPITQLQLIAEATKAGAGRLTETDVPYTLRDMATDALGLLDHLRIGSAHVVGISMGGMISQTLAILARDRVASLTSIASTTGDRRVDRPSLRAMSMFMRSRPTDPREAVEASVRNFRHFAGPHYDAARTRWRAERAIERSFDPIGVQRQTRAIISSPSRSPELRRLDTPTTVIHGAADTLIDISGGLRTATVVPNARFLPIEDMGHDILPVHYRQILDAIVENAARADGSRDPSVDHLAEPAVYPVGVVGPGE